MSGPGSSKSFNASMAASRAFWASDSAHIADRMSSGMRDLVLVTSSLSPSGDMLTAARSSSINCWLWAMASWASLLSSGLNCSLNSALSRMAWLACNLVRAPNRLCHVVPGCLAMAALTVVWALLNLARAFCTAFWADARLPTDGFSMSSSLVWALSRFREVVSTAL